MSGATLGKPLATDYHPPRDSMALRCLNESIEAWCAETGRTRKELAGLLGVSDAQFSRLTSGVQAFGVAQLDLLPRDLRLDFYQRVNQIDAGADLEALLAGRLAHAAINFLSCCKKPMAKMGGAPSQKFVTRVRKGVSPCST